MIIPQKSSGGSDPGRIPCHPTGALDDAVYPRLVQTIEATVRKPRASSRASLPKPFPSPNPHARTIKSMKKTEAIIEELNNSPLENQDISAVSGFYIPPIKKAEPPGPAFIFSL
jgi:hypothetical protein